MTNAFSLLVSLEAALKEVAPRTFEWEARMILKAVVGKEWAQLYAEGGTVSVKVETRVNQRVSRRLAGEPLAYVLGDAVFGELELKVGAGVLIPRVETEVLVGTALEMMPERERINILDLGTGSGCIALAVASADARVQVDAVENSAEALRYAAVNLASSGSAVRERVMLIALDYLLDDWSGNLKSAYDLILANPPYISEADWTALPTEVRREPREALVGGTNGDEILHRIIDRAPEHMVEGGALILEIGIGQSEDLRRFAESAGRLRWERTLLDHQGIERILVFKKPFAHD